MLRAELIEMQCEKRIGRFGLTVSRPLIIIASIKMRIIQIKAVARMTA